MLLTFTPVDAIENDRIRWADAVQAVEVVQLTSREGIRLANGQLKRADERMMGGSWCF